MKIIQKIWLKRNSKNYYINTIKNIITQYLDEKYPNNPYVFLITDVVLVKVPTKKYPKMIIDIYSIRPTIIIGKGGYEISRLSSFISKRINIALVINIKQNKGLSVNYKLLDKYELIQKA